MAPPQVSSVRIRFGLFEADLHAGELRKSGVKTRIQDLPFRALCLFLSRPGEVITRDELRQVLWPGDVFVDFNRGISSAIRRLRDALGDSADNPVFIETVERKGYRWIAPILPNPDLRDVVQEREPVRRPFPWWRPVFILPVLALLFAAWIYRSPYRNAKAGAKEPSRHSAVHRAANRDAEDLYLKGRFYWNRRTAESLNQAVDFFTQAIVRDPSYAAPYVGLADCYNLMREYTMMPANEAYPRALAAAKKAVELDGQSSEAHASLAFVSFYGMWDIGTADEEFRRAINLDPKNSKAHHWYATFLHSLRRDQDSLNEINRAQMLDPDSPSILADKGTIEWSAGQHEEALRLLRQVETAEPDFVSPHRYLRTIYFETQNYSGYLSEMKTEGILLHDNSLLAIAAAAKSGFARDGRTGMLLSELDTEKRLMEQEKISPYLPAETSARLGHAQDALHYLESSYERHAEDTVNANADAAFNGLRGVPAFQQLLARIGLPLTS